MTESAYHRILTAHERARTLCGTARLTGIPAQQVRKALITAELLDTDNWQAIRQLLAQRYTPEQIRAELHISRSTYNAHTPYTRIEPDNPTINALRIRQSRANKARANKTKEQPT